MNRNSYIDLDKCTEFRQALRAQSPSIVHGTAILLIITLSAAIGWMALTKADLIVAGVGRVRPISDTETSDERISQEISTPRDGRVIEVNVQVGDEVVAGDVLVRLDTTELDIHIDKVNANIAAGQAKLKEIDRSMQLLTQRHASAMQKAEAELSDARTEVDLAKRRRENDVALAKIELAEVHEKAVRANRLAKRGAVSDEMLTAAISRLREAQQKLRKAQLPLNDGKTAVLQRNLELLQRDYALEKQKLNAAGNTKRDEIEIATYDLAKLQVKKGEAVIRAPSDCMITKAEVKVGDMVRAGKMGMTTAHRRGYEFELEVLSSDVAHLRADMPVRIKMNAYDYQKYGTLDGRVRFITPDSTLKKLAEGRQTAVYTIKVALSEEELARGENRGEIKLGMTGKAEIVTDNESILLIFVRKLRQKISLG